MGPRTGEGGRAGWGEAAGGLRVGVDGSAPKVPAELLAARGPQDLPAQLLPAMESESCCHTFRQLPCSIREHGSIRVTLLCTATLSTLWGRWLVQVRPRTHRVKREEGLDAMAATVAAPVAALVRASPMLPPMRHGTSRGHAAMRPCRHAEAGQARRPVPPGCACTCTCGPACMHVRCAGVRVRPRHGALRVAVHGAAPLLPVHI